MFIKCANGGCPASFHYSHGAMVFRVETYGPKSHSKLDLSLEYHWLCPQCLHIVLVSWLDHGGTWPTGDRESTGKTVHLISLDMALADMWDDARASDCVGRIPRAPIFQDEVRDRFA